VPQRACLRGRLRTTVLAVTTPIRRSARLRRTTAASAALLLGLALAACGDDSEPSDEPAERTSSSAADDPTSDAPSEEPSQEPSEPSEPPAVVPTEDELAATLVTAADLPAGFTVDPDDGDDADSGFEGTCFEQVGDFEEALGAPPDAEAEVDLTAEGQAGQGFVSAQVEAYADPSAVATSFASFTDTLQQCTSIATTDEDGVTYDLQLDFDDTVDLPGADDQLRVLMSGEISSGAQTFPVVYQFVVAISAQFLSLVGTFTLGEDETGILEQTDALATLQAERVQAAFG
jgi:hypothetical protein